MQCSVKRSGDQVLVALCMLVGREFRCAYFGRQGLTMPSRESPVGQSGLEEFGRSRIGKSTRLSIVVIPSVSLGSPVGIEVEHCTIRSYEKPSSGVHGRSTGSQYAVANSVQVCRYFASMKAANLFPIDASMYQ